MNGIGRRAGATALLLTMATAAGGQSLDVRMRDQLRAANALLREAQADQARLAVGKLAAERERDALRAKLAETPRTAAAPARAGEAAADFADAADAAGLASGRVARAEAQAERAGARAKEAAARLAAAQAELARAHADRERAAAEATTLRSALTASEAKTARLTEAGRALIAAGKRRTGRRTALDAAAAGFEAAAAGTP